MRTSLVQGLSEAGYAVDATDDGREGLWYAEDAAYDAIVLDLMLPNLPGLSLLRRLREAGSTTPVLILTAKDTVPDRVTGLNEGADDYLIKPFAFEELLARVNALVRRKYEVGSPLVTVGDLSVDLKKRQVCWAGEPLTLTAREYELMAVLALHRGRIVTRSEISEHLYGFDAEPNSNAIDVHVAQLRRKLETPDRPRVIHTRRGLGYLLDEVDSCDP